MKYTKYLQRIIKNHSLVLVLFYQDNCPDSATMEVLLKVVQQRLNKPLKIIQLDIYLHPKAIQDYALENIPSCLIFQNQQLIFQQAGIVTSKQILTIIL